jgi:hypothetical protein
VRVKIEREYERELSKMDVKISFLYFIYPSSPPNTHLIEGLQVPQLLTKSSIENINRN